MFLHVKHMCRVGRLWASEAFTVRTTSDQEFSQHLTHIYECVCLSSASFVAEVGGAMGLWLGLGIMQFLEVNTSCSLNTQFLVDVRLASSY